MLATFKIALNIKSTLGPPSNQKKRVLKYIVNLREYY